MFSLPRPASSQLTTRAPSSLTAEVAEKKCAPDVDARAICVLRPRKVKARTKTRPTRRILFPSLVEHGSDASPGQSSSPHGVQAFCLRRSTYRTYGRIAGKCIPRLTHKSL